jgi:hypothetical protein
MNDIRLATSELVTHDHEPAFTDAPIAGPHPAQAAIQSKLAFAAPILALSTLGLTACGGGDSGS